jgi:hypothetical protein
MATKLFVFFAYIARLKFTIEFKCKQLIISTQNKLILLFSGQIPPKKGTCNLKLETRNS